MQRIKLTSELKVRLTEPMMQALKRLARQRESSTRQVSRQAINGYLENRGEISSTEALAA